MNDRLDGWWCPKCAKECVRAPSSNEPYCKQHGYVVDRIYRCHCGRPEDFRASGDVPQYAHYCARCAETLLADVRVHLQRVVARSSPATGPWRPA